MSGTINISQGYGLALNSFAFMYFEDTFRDIFMEQNPKLWEKVSGPLDLSILTARSLSQSEFRVFSKIVRNAYERAISENKIDDTEELWKALLEMIEKDQRTA